jgi:hypothetical protein
MNWKLGLVLFSLLIMSSAVCAQSVSYTVWSHTIDITLDDEGNAKITEIFSLLFPTEQDKIDFRNMSKEFGTNLNRWEEFDTRFTNTIGKSSGIKKQIAYNEGTNTYLELKYELNEPLMAKGKETSFRKQYIVKANFFDSLYQSGLWVIPDGTVLSVLLPPGADIEEQIEPESQIINDFSRKKIIWEGYKSGNKFSLTYVLWKKIPPIVDLNKTISFLFRTPEGLAVLAIIGLSIVGILWKRKKITKSIEGFVEDNTIFDERDSDNLK